MNICLPTTIAIPNKYPVVIFLHGIGERGPNTTDLQILKEMGFEPGTVICLKKSVKYATVDFVNMEGVE